MKSLPTKANAQGMPLTVADFYEAGRGPLQLTLVAGGRGLSCRIAEPIMNRPGLALTGFYEHFAWKRPQLIGKAEMAYLRSLPPEVRLSRVRSLIERRATCFVYTSGLRPSREEVALAQTTDAVIMTSPMKTRLFAHHSAFVLEKLSAPRTSIYGTMIEVCGLGVLFEGDPGLGKSETALGLVRRGHALIADDLTCVRKDVGNNVLYGSASDSTAGYMELRGIGIMHVPSIFGISAVRGEKQLQLVITFKLLKDVEGKLDRIGQTRRTRKILGVEVPNVIIPVSEGRDLVNLVETAAMQQRLILAGGDPVRALSERLHRRAEEKKESAERRRGKNG